MPLGDSCLVNVSGDDQLDARTGQRLQNGVPSSERALVPSAPGRRRQGVVKGDDAKRTGRNALELRRSSL